MRLKNWCPDCQLYVTDLHSGLSCKEYKETLTKKTNQLAANDAKKLVEQCIARRELNHNERETKRFAVEAAWKSELASWPSFVPLNPIDPSQVVVRDREWLKQQPTWGVNLPTTPSNNLPNRPRRAKRTRCLHHNLHLFTFSACIGGETIYMCPGCTLWDKRRQDILRNGEAEQPKQAELLRSEKKLEAAGLSMNAGWSSELSYYSNNKMGNIEHAQASRKRWGGERVSLRSRFADGDTNDEASVLVKTADKGLRDYRADKLAKNEERPEAQATCNCQGCGLSFVPSRKGHTKYCSSNCSKLNYKKRQRRKK